MNLSYLTENNIPDIAVLWLYSLFSAALLFAVAGFFAVQIRDANLIYYLWPGTIGVLVGTPTLFFGVRNQLRLIVPKIENPFARTITLVVHKTFLDHDFSKSLLISEHYSQNGDFFKLKADEKVRLEIRTHASTQELRFSLDGRLLLWGNYRQMLRSVSVTMYGISLIAERPDRSVKPGDNS